MLSDNLNGLYAGVVEDILDPKRKGRIKVRIERFHGRKSDKKFIPTEDIPWAIPTLDVTGCSFSVPSVGKVLHVSFLDGDRYKPVYEDVEHYNINLQEKLQSLNNEQYLDFWALSYDDKHQYYHEKDKGVVFDYLKSNMNIDTKGNINLNLRDNKSKLFLGTEDASQQAMLGNHWMTWFEELVQNLIGAKGGPYLGNLGAPIIPTPGMIEVLNKFLAMKEKFLSDHVFIVDDNRVKSQDRKFDKTQLYDNFNDEKQEIIKGAEQVGYQPEERKVGVDKPKTANIPPQTFSDNLKSEELPAKPTADDLIKTVAPTPVGNGQYDISQLTKSKYLAMEFSDDQAYLLDVAAESLDKMLDAYHNTNKTTTIHAIKGYQSYERQKNIREQFSVVAPVPGTSPFGYANQVVLNWGIFKTVDKLAAKKFLNSGVYTGITTIKTLKWLIENSKQYGWKLAGKDKNSETQWWHWIYTG
jgi:LAS superfamily LD-carboxypeptidase LdcB